VTPARESWFDIFVETYISKEKKTGRLLQTCTWEISREINGQQSEGHYKIKVYHMDDDEFRAKCYPASL